MTENINALPTHPDAPVIEKLVREEVDRQLSTQRQVFGDAVGLATKIVGVAFALLIGIFTLFSLTTWKDIKAETAAIVRKQTEELIKGADAETGVKSALNNLMNRAVVASTI